MAWDLDFSGETLDQVDKSGGHPPDDYYKVTLAETTENQKDGSQEFVFKITDGPHKGRNVKGKLWNPRFADDAEKGENAKRKAKLWGVRLGLVPKEAEGKTAAIDWHKAVGWSGVVKQNTRIDKATGVKGNFPEVDYAGIYPLDHHDLDGPTRTRLGLTLLPGQSATTAPASARGKKGDEGTTTAPAVPAQNPADIAKQLWG